MDELAELSALDDRLMAAAGSVKVLSTLAWKPEVEAEFLSGWQRADPRRRPDPIGTLPACSSTWVSRG